MNMQRSRGGPTVALVALLPCVLSACGVLLTHGPPPDHEQLDSFSCTQSNEGPIGDLVWGGLNLLGALSIAGNPDRYTNSQQAIASGLAWAVVSFISAAVGFDKTSRCLAAKRELAARRARAEQVGAGAHVDVPDIQTVQLSPGIDTLIVGDQIQLVATAFASSGSGVADRPFRWSSSNDAIASVSNAGLVTAHAAGSVLIAANTNNVVGTASVVVVSQR